jgi:hypothetical protein
MPKCFGSSPTGPALSRAGFSSSFECDSGETLRGACLPSGASGHLTDGGRDGIMGAMSRLLIAALVTLFSPLLFFSSADASRPLVLSVKVGEQTLQKSIPCQRRCRPAARIYAAAVAPKYGRWVCDGTASTTPPFLARARWQGRLLARFVPGDICGLRQWEMVRSIFYRAFGAEIFRAS